MVSLDRLSDAEKATLCKRYFFFGIPLLPMIWLVNAAWFYKHAYSKEEFAEQPTIKLCKTKSTAHVRASAIGAVIWLLAIVAWTAFYQMNRAQGAAWTDYLAFVYPLGHV